MKNILFLKSNHQFTPIFFALDKELKRLKEDNFCNSFTNNWIAKVAIAREIAYCYSNNIKMFPYLDVDQDMLDFTIKINKNLNNMKEFDAAFSDLIAQAENELDFGENEALIGSHYEDAEACLAKIIGSHLVERLIDAEDIEELELAQQLFDKTVNIVKNDLLEQIEEAKKNSLNQFDSEQQLKETYSV